MKTATEQPAPGQVVETTTRRRILPLDGAPQGARTTPEYWEYLSSLDRQPEEWERHIIYVYRTDPKPSTPVEKCSQFMALPDGNRISMSDREEIEFALAKRFGGREFRFIVKRGSERITETKVFVDAPPKPLSSSESTNGNGATVTPYSSSMSEASATAVVAGRAMDALTMQEKQSAQIGFEAMRTAADVMQRFSKPEGTSSDDLTRQFMQAMIARMVAPPPDPLETLTRLLAIMNSVGTAGAAPGAPRDPLVTKILETGLERVLNPTSATPAVSASAELVRQLPQVAAYASQAIHEWRTGMEAQRDTVALARGLPPQPGAPAAPGAPARALPPQAQPAPNPAEVQPNGGAGVPSLEFVESKIVEILREPVSAEQAADDALHFLGVLGGGLIEQLTAQGETGLLQLFQGRPILKQATTNMPRLIEFVRAFLKLHAEDAGEGNERKPN